jgi:hypothetical protein
VYKTEKHKGVINSIDGVGGTTTDCGAPEIVTGSKDGKSSSCKKFSLITKFPKGLL